MRTAEQWFDAYAESHQNPVNKAIHWICIPLIYLSTFGLLAAIPLPAMAGALIGAAVAMAFYARLSLTILAGMAAFTALCMAVNAGIAASGLSLFGVSVGIFAVAWVAQFIGHKIEGKKPSFFDELPFLLVGPAWLLQFVYRRVGVPVVTGRPAAS
jgi:uncharacterized membrane protein YGL010W